MDDILGNASISKIPLGWRDKLRVAVKLTSGVLQLYKTPWLNEKWTERDVLFLHRPGTPTSSMFEHPFVRCKLSPTSHQDALSQPIKAYRVIRNTTLYVLGVILVELCFGQPIQKLQIVEDLRCEGTPGVTWCTANRLIETKEIENFAGWRYAEAVRHCIWCDFGVVDVDLDSDKFLQMVYEGVFEKLEESLQHIEG